MTVPILNFADFNSGSYVFNGPTTMISPQLTRTTSIAAFSAEILAMPAVANNISYTLQFHGPSLRCDEATANIAALIENVYRATSSAIAQRGSGDAAYLSFTAHASFLQNSSVDPTTAQDLLLWNHSKIATELVSGKLDWTYTPQDNLDAPSAFAMLVHHNEKRLACAPQNTTYKVTFNSSGIIQTVSHPYEFIWEGLPAPSQLHYYYTAMALANLLNGVIGKIEMSNGGHQQSVVKTFVMSSRTKIMQTALIGAVGEYQPLPQEDKRLARNMSLGPLIEELSRNQTLSLFSSSRFW